MDITQLGVNPSMTVSLKSCSTFALGALILTGLYLTSLQSYLLFHTLAEMFSIVVAFGIFIIGWNSKNYIRNNYLVFLATAYLFIAFLDLLHTMSYKGMGIFTSYDYYANQLWIATRYMESLSLLIAFLFLRNDRTFNPYAAFAGFTAVTALITASIFWWHVFPICFVDGQGLTPFKKISEYIICAILLVDIWILWLVRHRFDATIFRWLIWSLVFTIAAELAFTFYISNYGFSNLVGHYFKIFSFYFIYKALVETGIRKPHAVMFKALQDSESKFRSLVESSRDFIWEEDRHGVYTYASPHVTSILGYSPEEMIGRHIHEFMLPEEAARARQLFDIDDGVCPCQVESESVFLHKDGHHVILERNGASIQDRNGKVLGFRGVDRDVTERRRHERELRKLIRALEDNPIAIIITDPHGKVEYDNPAFRELMEGDSEDWKGQDFVSLMTAGRKSDIFTKLREILAAGEPWQGELNHHRTDGKSQWIHLSVAPIREDGVLTNHVATLEDISDRKDLEILKENVDQIMRHDLKGPLNGIINIPMLLQSEPNITKEQRIMLELTENTGRRMLRMINNSLNLLKMEQGTFEYEPDDVDVLETLRSVMDEMGSTYRAMGVTVNLTVDGAPPAGPFLVKAEKDLFHNILNNLVTNAVEASKPGDTVDVMLESGDSPVVRIQNKGAVPWEIRNNFFQKYKTHGKANGTGLGTYSAKLIADALGLKLHLLISDDEDMTTIEIHCPGC